MFVQILVLVFVLENAGERQKDFKPGRGLGRMFVDTKGYIPLIRETPLHQIGVPPAASSF